MSGCFQAPELYGIRNRTNTPRYVNMPMKYSAILMSEYRGYSIFMPPTLKKLMGHIAFGVCVRACVGMCVTLFVPTVTFKPLKLES